jgi:NSS family neurotransmitter:Na+ symporter
MPGGVFFGTLFFMLLVFAAWTSSISLIEPAVAWLVENHGLTRMRAAVVVGVATWLMGVVTVLSFNHWEQYKFLGKTAFELLDFVTANLVLPLGGMAIAVFTAWFMSRKVVRNEMAIQDRRLHDLWFFLLKYVSPIGILIVFLNLLGVF